MDGMNEEPNVNGDWVAGDKVDGDKVLGDKTVYVESIVQTTPALTEYLRGIAEDPRLLDLRRRYVDLGAESFLAAARRL
ncbi:MAG: hypothetical protein M5R40_18670 [Anaerolineae bacterium]|nr:hypothetical protein [Anaerolineae bacterium]